MHSNLNETQENNVIQKSVLRGYFHNVTVLKGKLQKWKQVSPCWN